MVEHWRQATGSTEHRLDDRGGLSIALVYAARTGIRAGSSIRYCWFRAPQPALSNGPSGIPEKRWPPVSGPARGSLVVEPGNALRKAFAFQTTAGYGHESDRYPALH